MADPGSRSDLDHPQAPAVGQLRNQRLDGVCQHPIGGARHRRLQVKVGRRRFAAAEQQRQRVLVAAQHVGQGEARPPEEPDLDLAVGIHPRHSISELVDVAWHVFRQRVVQTHDHFEPVLGLLHNTRVGEHFEHAAEDALVLRQDVEPFPQILGVNDLAQRSLPSQLFQGRERPGPRPSLQIGQQRVPAVGIDAGVRQIAGEHL